MIDSFILPFLKLHVPWYMYVLHLVLYKKNVFIRCVKPSLRLSIANETSHSKTTNLLQWLRVSYTNLNTVHRLQSTVFHHQYPVYEDTWWPNVISNHTLDLRYKTICWSTKQRNIHHKINLQIFLVTNVIKDLWIVHDWEISATLE
jgi:hypothetical protein